MIPGFYLQQQKGHPGDENEKEQRRNTPGKAQQQTTGEGQEKVSSGVPIHTAPGDGVLPHIKNLPANGSRRNHPGDESCREMRLSRALHRWPVTDELRSRTPQEKSVMRFLFH